MAESSSSLIPRFRRRDLRKLPFQKDCSYEATAARVLDLTGDDTYLMGAFNGVKKHHQRSRAAACSNRSWQGDFEIRYLDIEVRSRRWQWNLSNAPRHIVCFSEVWRSFAGRCGDQEPRAHRRNCKCECA